MIEQSFEAGINCLLDDVGGDDEAHDPKEVVDLRRSLLESLISQSEAAELLQNKALGTAIVRTAFQQTRHNAD